MNDSLITVIIPTYNRFDSLPKAIESVLEQRYKSWELLIVDDGSTDNTKKLLQEKYLDDPRIYFIERPDSRVKGANACRNIGMEKARGKYIAFLDSDDEWGENHLISCLQVARNNTDFYGCYSGAVIKRGRIDLVKKSREVKSEETHLDFLLNGGYAPTPSLFLKKKEALTIKFDEKLQRHQDWDFFIRFGEKFSWTFNNSCNVIINRSLNNPLKNINFNSCIKFYKTNKNRISKDDLRDKYLYSMYEKSLLCNEIHAARFYRNELREAGYTKNLAFRFPKIYCFIKKCGDILNIEEIKGFIVCNIKKAWGKSHT